MPDEEENTEDLGAIKARFWVTKKGAAIFCEYRGIKLQMRWDFDGENEDEIIKNTQRLVGNLPAVLKDCHEEAFIQHQKHHLDEEIDDLLGDL